MRADLKEGTADPWYSEEPERGLCASGPRWTERPGKETWCGQHDMGPSRSRCRVTFLC